MNAGINKLLIPIRGKTVISRSIEAFRGLTDEMMIAACPADLEEIRQEAERAEADFPIAVVPGGQTRQESILLALKSAAFGEDDLVLVHDGARCFVEADVIRRVIDACLEKGSGVPGIPVTSTIKMTDHPGYDIVETPADERTARLVHVYRLVVTEFAPPLVTFDLLCTKGVCVRALANDIGAALGCGACLESLRRVKCGPLDVANAIGFMDLMKLDAVDFRARVIKPAGVYAQ
jgi:CTP:molybdopterin cytidylyltransferase MocA